jgi:hypothetical protein
LWVLAEVESYGKHIGEFFILFVHLGKVMVNMTSVVLVTGRGMRIGIVNGWA